MFSNITSEKMQGYLAGLVVICLALAVVIVGVPSPEEILAEENEARLAARSVFVAPAELLDLTHYNGDDLHLLMLDVRSAEDYENFHIPGAQNMPVAEVATVLETDLITDTTAIVVMSNDETAALEAWWTLASHEGVSAYMLCGGVNNWLGTFVDESLKESLAVAEPQDDEAAYVFDGSLMAEAGKRRAAEPDPADFEIEYDAAIKIGAGGGGAEVEEEAPADAGGCG